MACLLATDSLSGARGGNAPVDRVPARPIPGPEPPVPPPPPTAGTWQKRPVKSGGHRHWFREEHWPPFMQGRGHTTGEGRRIRAREDPHSQPAGPVPQPHPVLTSLLPLPCCPVALPSLGSWVCNTSHTHTHTQPLRSPEIFLSVLASGFLSPGLKSQLGGYVLVVWL